VHWIFFYLRSSPAGTRWKVPNSITSATRTPHFTRTGISGRRPSGIGTICWKLRENLQKTWLDLCPLWSNLLERWWWMSTCQQEIILCTISTGFVASELTFCLCFLKKSCFIDWLVVLDDEYNDFPIWWCQERNQGVKSMGEWSGFLSKCVKFTIFAHCLVKTEVAGILLWNIFTARFWKYRYEFGDRDAGTAVTREGSKRVEGNGNL